jgi:ABC-type nitrate/sulfonate/bicarbonate transport system substrate-binding protein
MSKALLALALILTLGGCQRNSPENATPRDAEARRKITVAYTFQPQSTLVHVAVAKGYLSEEGLDVLPLMHTFGKAALQSVLDGKADFATVAETPVMFNVLKGEKIFVLANIEASSMNNAVVARKDAGIAAPADLKGKRIGVTSGTTTDFFLDSLLTANGLIRTEVQPVALKPEEMQDAILANRVDAVSVWNYPLTQIKRQLGSNGIVFYDREIYTETFNVASKQEFVKKNPDTVKRFLRALIKAENFVMKNPNDAQAIMAASTKTDSDLVREVWNAFNYRVALDQILLIALEDETRWAMKNKLTDQTVMPNYMSFIHLDSLREIKPEVVRMHR